MLLSLLLILKVMSWHTFNQKKQDLVEEYNTVTWARPLGAPVSMSQLVNC